MKRIGLVFLMVWGGGTMAQGVRVLTLGDCIGIALQRSTAVLKGNNDVALAGTQVMAAYGQFLPNVQAVGGVNYDKGNNWFGSTGIALANEARGVYNYQLTSSVNLFTGYFNRSSLNQAKLNQQVSGLTLERAKQQIELDITQSYLQLILDRKIVVLDSNNLTVSLDREHQLSMLTDVGRTARTDLYQQQAQTSSDQLLLINARSRMQDDKILLLQKLRIDSGGNYEIADIPIDDEAEAGKYGNADALVTEGVQLRIDLRSADLNIQANDWNIRKLKSGYLPTVSASGGFFNDGGWFNSLKVNGVEELPGSQTPVSTQLYKNSYGLLGVNATWNIFDRYATRSNVAAARLLRDDARIDREDVKIGIVASIRLAHNDYRNAVQQMETVGKGLVAAQEAFDAVNARYRQGATDFITESNSQQVLLQAQQNKIQASVNMMLQKKAIDFFTGTIAP
ncbi:TolC family protein [Puia sp.]|jgi:outer membrane protein|uniref:TolC family protein n=1 Tax=Puia sp. TaxID=2045100 RepID=UPI002F3E6BE7